MKKSILFIMSTMGGGGAEKVLSDILHWLDYDRFDVSLLLMSRGGVYYDTIPGQVKIYSLDDFNQKPPKFIVNRFTLPIWNKYCLNKVLPKERFDVIISFMEGRAVYYHSFLTGRADKNLSWVHIDLFTNHWTRRYFRSDNHEREAYRKMDRIVFVSQQAEKQFGRLFGTDFPTEVVYNIIDKENILRRSQEPVDIEKGAKITLCNIGRINAQKRQDRLIDAVAILHKDFGLDVEAWILGKGDLEDKLRQQAENLGIADKIRFLGFQTNPYAYLKRADAFVLSSESEGYPLVCAEALTLGKPVVATRVTGPTEMLEGGAGILTHLTPRALAEGIYKLFADEATNKEYARRAKERSMIFDPKITMEQINSLL